MMVVVAGQSSIEIVHYSEMNAPGLMAATAHCRCGAP